MMRYIKIMLLSVVLFCSYNMMAQTYDLHICGTQVTKENCADLSVIQGITLTKRDGKAEYSPTLNVLFLKDVMIVDTSGTAITSSLDNLTIVVNGTVNILSRAIRGIGLQLNKPTNLRGGESSKMNLTTGGVGIMLDSSLSISNLQLKVTSENYGIGGNTSIVSLRKTYLGSLSIKGQESVVEVNGKTGSIISLDKLELSDGLGITSPSGATFYNHNVSLSGSTVKDDTVVIQYAEMSSHKKGDVNLDGSVDISDIVAVINQIAGTATYSNADVNGDTNVDISDIVAIINIIANGSDDEDLEKPEEPDAAVKAGYCPDNHHPHMIDFGEGKKWACCNVGASAPWEYGNYYAWGELEPKDIYTWDNYTFLNEETGKYVSLITIRNSQNDVAYQSWGGMWNMPDTEDIEKLGAIANNSDVVGWTTLNGVNGWKIQDQTGHAIFLPAAGLQGPDGPEYVGEKGTYWTSDRSYGIYASGFSQLDPYAWIISFTPDTFNKFTPYRINCRERAFGLPVRPVINEDIETDDMDISVVNHICPDSHHPHEIDMGGGGIWLCCNLGASVPWEYGSYYAWGETEADKKSYEWSTYTFCDGDDDYNGCRFIGNDIGGTAYDAVRKQMGNPWSMPSAGQAQWLSDNCTFEWISMHSISGLKVTAPNGNSLFLPASGCKTKNGSYNITPNDGICYSLSSMHMAYPYMNKTMETSNGTSMNVTSANRCIGQSLRPVKHNTPEEPSVAAGICPDSHHPHAIDLGTGVKWSCCNLGASVPWHYGDFYAWGETSTKSDYDVDTYSLGDGTFENCTDIGTDIAGTEYDAAHISWGNSWTMPSYEQAQLLAEGCTVTWTNLDGIDGVMLTGKNGNRIFLPFTGGYWGENLSNTNGGLWTSTANTNEDVRAYFLDITYDFTDKNNLVGDVKTKSIWRFIGKAIRPVK